jgi:hypothetical protein
MNGNGILSIVDGKIYQRPKSNLTLREGIQNGDPDSTPDPTHICTVLISEEPVPNN